MSSPVRYPLALALAAACSLALLPQTSTAATVVTPPTGWWSLLVASSHTLSTADTAKVQNGMNGDQVRTLLGTPDNTVRFPRTDTVAWDYALRDAWGYDAQFSVIFDHVGTVVGKVTTRRDP
jgi:outer membrane protein assembly factor BamE (lipoprotein component of BamABCDE complex)